MMSASAISAQIRAKKKKMEEEHSGAVKLSGIPEDATDIDTIKQHEATDAMNMNMPKDRDEDPSLASLDAEAKASGGMVGEPEDPKQVNQPEDGPVESRKAKIRKMLTKMGK